MPIRRRATGAFYQQACKGIRPLYSRLLYVPVQSRVERVLVYYHQVRGHSGLEAVPVGVGILPRGLELSVWIQDICEAIGAFWKDGAVHNSDGFSFG